MLTYEASVTFAPHSTVTGLVLSPDGETIAWSESNGSVNIYQDMKKVNEIEVMQGVRSLTMRTSIKDVVTISGSLEGGSLYAPTDNKQIANIASAMIDKGTDQKDGQGFHESPPKDFRALQTRVRINPGWQTHS